MCLIAMDVLIWECVDMCLMWHKYHEVIDADFDFNLSYGELQNSLAKMRDDLMDVFKRTNTQKKLVLKLEAEPLKLQKYLESLKNDHASIVNKHIVNPSIESPKVDPPKYLNWMSFSSYEVCPGLHEVIKYLKSKLEQASKAHMVFAMNSKDERPPFMRPYKKILFC